MAQTITTNDFGVYAEYTLAFKSGEVRKKISVRNYFHEPNIFVRTVFVVYNRIANQEFEFDSTDYQSAIDKYNSIGN